MTEEKSDPDILLEENDEKTDLAGKITFEDLPPRVIIYDILPYFQYHRVSEKNKSKYMNFGYFKKDRFRTIWFVFSSVSLFFGGHDYSGKVTVGYMDCERLVSLDLGDPTTHFLTNLKNVSPRMRSLESLNVSFVLILRDFSGLQSLFSLPKCFPVLRSLDLSNCSFSDQFLQIDWKVSEEDNIFRRIQRFRLTEHSQSSITITESNIKNVFEQLGPNIRSFSHNIHSPNPFPRNVTLDFPNIDFLMFYNNSKRLRINPGEKMKKLDYKRHVKGTEAEEFLPRLRFFVKKLEQLSIEVNVGEGHGVTEDFLSYDFPALRKLKIAIKGFFQFPMKKWKIFENVEDLGIQFGGSLGSSGIEVFQMNDFTKLKKLEVSYYHLRGEKLRDVGGVSWGNMPCLEELKISGMIVGDDLFQKERFGSLKVLEVTKSGEQSITGTGWNVKNVEKLERMKLDYFPKLEKDLFVSGGLKNLEKLEIHRGRATDHLSCVGWKVPKLKVFWTSDGSGWEEEKLDNEFRNHLPKDCFSLFGYRS